MSVMDFIKKIASNRSEKSQRFKEMQEEDKLHTMLEERKKSSNRRELEKYYEKEEEKQIKKALDKVHKKQEKEMWSRNDFIGKKTTILKDNKKMLRNDNPILKQKNIFMDGKSQVPVTKKKALFFK